ncbi:phosphate ABC transporter substrate-binding protein, partial [Streptomyces sp. NPDC059082]
LGLLYAPPGPPAAAPGRGRPAAPAAPAPARALDELGTSPYPYREIEYAYTWGVPRADSLTADFLTYLRSGRGQDVISAHGHLPCSTPKGLKVCGED